MSNPNLYIAPSDIAGRGVFTAKKIEAGEIIEICPALLISARDLKVVHQTRLHDYYFSWENRKGAIALGFGSLYNHAADANAVYRMDFEHQSIDIFCKKDIAAFEEITISYIYEEDDPRSLWFEVL